MFLHQAETASSILYIISTFVVTDASKNLQIPVLCVEIYLKKNILKQT